MCWFSLPKKKKRMDKPFINMAFGPDSAWIIWLSASPGSKEPPHYRSSVALPTTLERRLYGRHKDVKVIHAVALGQDENFIMSFTSDVNGDHHLGHLDKYPSLDRWLIENPCDESTFWASLGPEAEYFASSKKMPHWSVDEEELEDKLQELGKQKVAWVAFGIGGCSIVLDKDGRLTLIGDTEERYPSLKTILESHKALPVKVGGKRNKGRIVRSVALSPFCDDEFFISFEDGTSECHSDAIKAGYNLKAQSVVDTLRDEYKYRCDKSFPKPNLTEENKTYSDCKIPHLLATNGKAKSGYKVKEWPDS